MSIDTIMCINKLYFVFSEFIPGGPEITEQSIQSIFQDFALINSYFLCLVG